MKKLENKLKANLPIYFNHIIYTETPPDIKIIKNSFISNKTFRMKSNQTPDLPRILLHIEK